MGSYTSVGVSNSDTPTAWARQQVAGRKDVFKNSLTIGANSSARFFAPTRGGAGRPVFGELYDYVLQQGFLPADEVFLCFHQMLMGVEPGGRPNAQWNGWRTKEGRKGKSKKIKNK